MRKMVQKARQGLRIVGHRGQTEVKESFKRYAKWLRKHYSFPIRCPVYLSQEELLTTMSGEFATASFFAPFDRAEEPYIRIATGDYETLFRERGRDNCLAAFLHSLSHELVHYFQWVETGRIWEKGVVRKASAMVDRYASEVEHP